LDFLKKEWLTVTVDNWKLWGPANAINFMFVPAPFQVLFANFTGVMWNCYMSWKAHQAEEHAHGTDSKHGNSHAEAEAEEEEALVGSGTAAAEVAAPAAATAAASAGAGAGAGPGVGAK
jgi:hypothetical protein